MPWAIERQGSALLVRITPPVLGEWEAVLEEIKANLDSSPLVVYLPPTIHGASAIDVDMLGELWATIRGIGVSVLPSP